jgi:CubicO group peptidase (beta-lactamase class C family)
MKEYEEKGFSGSVLVERRGEVLLQEGYGFANKSGQIPNAANTIFDFGSLTKQFTGAAIVKAETLGLLNVEQKLTDYFSDVPEDKTSITIHQLLTHSSGLQDVLGDDYDLIAKEEFVDLALESALVFTPGKGYNYSNAGYSLLGIILEQVSGLSYESFLTTYLFSPSGMEATGYNSLKSPSFQDRIAVGYINGVADGRPTEMPWLDDGPGWHLRANGGILTTVEEMSMWIKALNDKKVFDEMALKKYLTPYVKEDGESSYYSYGWVVSDSDQDTFYWHDGGNGVFSAIAVFYPETETVIVMVSNDSAIEVFDMAAEVVDLIADE